MLEQEAHIFGFRDNELPLFPIGSPQQMQMRGFIKDYKFSYTSTIS
jgi:hypothetical protein